MLKLPNTICIWYTHFALFLPRQTLSRRGKRIGQKKSNCLKRREIHKDHFVFNVKKWCTSEQHLQVAVIFTCSCRNMTSVPKRLNHILPPRSDWLLFDCRYIDMDYSNYIIRIMNKRNPVIDPCGTTFYEGIGFKQRISNSSVTEGILFLYYLMNYSESAELNGNQNFRKYFVLSTSFELHWSL